MDAYVPVSTKAVYEAIVPEDYLKWLRDEKGSQEFKNFVENAIDEDFVEGLALGSMMNYVEEHCNQGELTEMAMNKVTKEAMLEYLKEEMGSKFFSELANMVHHGDLDLKKILEKVGWSEVTEIMEREGKIHRHTLKAPPPIGHVTSRRIEIEMAA